MTSDVRVTAHFCFIWLNVDFTGVVSTVGGGGVLRKKTKQKNQQKNKKQQQNKQKTKNKMLVVVAGEQYLWEYSAEEGRGYGGQVKIDEIRVLFR